VYDRLTGPPGAGLAGCAAVNSARTGVRCGGPGRTAPTILANSSRSAFAGTIAIEKSVKW
jgi:hypothetical protein